jgi:hypothetical protein
MVVCHIRKIIFIHIPKTAGSSIEHLLRDEGNYELDFIGVRNGRSTHHYMGIELKMILKELYPTYYKFSFVRNPYDRLISEYFWCRIKDVGHKFNKTFDEFLDYVEDVIKNKKFFKPIENDHFIPQYSFLFFNNKLIVNNIFKYEDIETVVPLIRKRLKIKTVLQHLNKSNKNEITLTNEQKDRIYNLYKIDFQTFNYEK